LTVTDPETTRYFMTIPEAVQLILKASLLPDFAGHIVMLDMGEPVKIVDLAENLLRLSGVPVTADRIVFTGLRPGEKLHEELAAPDEETMQTEIEKIRIIRSRPHEFGALLRRIEIWRHDLESGHLTTIEQDFAALFPGLPLSLQGHQARNANFAVVAGDCYRSHHATAPMVTSPYSYVGPDFVLAPPGASSCTPATRRRRCAVGR